MMNHLESPHFFKIRHRMLVVEKTLCRVNKAPTCLQQIHETRSPCALEHRSCWKP